MIGRCGNPHNKSFARYGGRGITVCERWLTFENFLADMGPKPSPEHSIDRINVNGNYEPGNCRWATRVQQARNKSTTIFLTIDGVSRPLPEWAELRGIDARALRHRIADLGWSAIDAVSMPVFVGRPAVSPGATSASERGRRRNGNHNITFNGETMCLTAWAERVGVTATNLSNRLRSGWSIERALSEPTRSSSTHAAAEVSKTALTGFRTPIGAACRPSDPCALNRREESAS